MKTIKQIISDADPRLKGVLVIMVVYVMVMATTVTSGATQEIKGYKETIEIQYQDGGQETKDYLVRQDTVKNVLKELDVNLNAKDTVNKDMSDIEYHILLLMMQHAGKIFSAQNLYESVWQEPYFYSCNSTVMVHIRKLRVKIEDDPKNPKYIKTVWGKGYKFDTDSK